MESEKYLKGYKDPFKYLSIRNGVKKKNLFYGKKQIKIKMNPFLRHCRCLLLFGILFQSQILESFQPPVPSRSQYWHPEKQEKTLPSPYLEFLEINTKIRAQPLYTQKSRFREEHGEEPPRKRGRPRKQKDETEMKKPPLTNRIFRVEGGNGRRPAILGLFLPATGPGEEVEEERETARSENDHRRPETTSESGAFRLEHVENYNFTRVGGYTNVKDELYQIMDFVRFPEKYTRHGVRLPRGILLEGPTGNGKTLIAKCLAGETRMNFISCSGSEFNEKYVGVGAARVRELFRFAKKSAPCILFIDEIDAVGRRRGSDQEAAGAERDQTLNQMLVMMDGFQTDTEKQGESVLVIGATNRVDVLDPALLRPGRFDKVIHVPNPDGHTRREILEIHSDKKPVNASLEYLVQATHGFNGAQIENLLNEAVLMAIRTNETLPVNLTTIDHIREKILVGQTTSISKRSSTAPATIRVAVHEIGHLLMAIRSPHCEKPWKVTIDSLNPQSALGYTLFETMEEEKAGLYTREYFEDKIRILLGGRAAEEVFYGNSITSGALSDLESAFAMAKKMVMEYGMGKEIIYPYFSETYKKRIDEQIHAIIVRAYQDTRSYLAENRHVVDRLSVVLLHRRTLFLEEIREVMKETSTPLSS